MSSSAKSTRPRLHAVALSRLPYAIGGIIRRAFGGRDTFILERDGLPVAALVNARDWLAYLDARFPGISSSVNRAEFAAPYVRPERRPPPRTRRRKARTGTKRSAAIRKPNATRRKTKRGARVAAKAPVKPRGTQGKTARKGGSRKQAARVRTARVPRQKPSRQRTGGRKKK
jgi:hypothetical protein